VIERPRLLPAVILGAMGLLALKLLAWTAEPSPGHIPSAAPLYAQAAAKPTNKASTKVYDTETTGSVPAPDPKKEPDKKEAEAKAEAARAANPNNKAGIINGTAQPVSPAEKAILERLGERREELEGRMRELEMRERLLNSAEKKLDGRVGDLKALEEKTGGPGAGTAAAAEEAKAIKNLVIMYESMKPKDAARVFDRLGLDVLVPVVQQMNPRKMSEVLAAMAPDRAEKLTVALATSGRSASVERVTNEASLPGNELPAIAPQR
jgi:flagellar motility protein MotE (MotC chaperone)